MTERVVVQGLETGDRCSINNCKNNAVVLIYIGKELRLCERHLEELYSKLRALLWQ